LFLTYDFPTLTEAMQKNNSATEFILLGLTQNPLRQKLVVFIFFVLYVGTLVGNILITVTIKSSKTLGSPMYFFLFYLSFANSCFSTTTAPRLIVDALSTKKVISYNECMTQVFALHLFVCMEIFVLILMPIDHCVAICKSLHYSRSVTC
jgi:olfactory receptor